MKHLFLAPLLATASFALVGCPGTSNPMSGGESPQQDEWQPVVKGLAFPLDGDGAITQITVGRKEYNENFANRGDIEVLYDHDEPTISIEMRKYTFGEMADAFGDDTTEGTFPRMSLWAYAGTGNPTKPSQQMATDDCTKDAWKNNCRVYVYYDGQSQPTRSGADFRVHLPRGYRGKLNLQTEDNTSEDSYPRRGNLKVDGLCSGGDLRLSAGRANIKMCADLQPVPTCAAADNKKCNEVGWTAAECACDVQDFGQLRIEASKPWAANITVDIPQTTWLNTTLQNTSDMKPHECRPVIDNCAQGKCVQMNPDAYTATAEFNYPGMESPMGAGFNLTVISGACNPIPYVDAPDDWSADAEPPEELRGNLKVCSGCVK